MASATLAPRNMVGGVLLIACMCNLALAGPLHPHALSVRTEDKEPVETINVTEEEMAAAREAWGTGLIAISKAYDDEGIEPAKKLASDIIDSAYGYQMGPVMFKPTLANGEQTFRPTKEGCLSYFVAHNPEYPNDGGFALKSWVKVETETSASFAEGDVAMWMGWMHFTNSKGEVTTVDKSFGYKKDDAGTLRIVLHHSSLPYPGPAISDAEMAAAREAWGTGLVEISKAYDEEGLCAARYIAKNVIDSAYAYNLGAVMFKPTLASGELTFRPTMEGALSYFVADNEDYPLDTGFALKSWRKVTTETSASYSEAGVGMWMGWMHFTDVNGTVTTVDKSFGYRKDAEGHLRIVLHHSSLPYNPDA